MFKKLSSRFILIISLVLSVNLLANEQDSKQFLVNNVIEISGVTEQFSTFDVVMQDTMSRMLATNTELNTDEKENLKTIILKDLRQEAIVNAIKQSIATKMSEDELKSILLAYQSDIMQKVKAATLNASKPEAQQEFMNFAMNIGKNPLSDKRLKQVKKLDEVLQASKFQAELMGKMLSTMMTSFNQLDHKLTAEKLAQTITNVNMFMQEAAKEQVKMSFLFTFKDLSDDDIDNYIKTEESNNSLLALNKNIFSGVNEFFTEYSAYLGTELAKFADNLKKSA